MATTKEVINKVKAVLDADTTLSGYIKSVSLGLRRGMLRQEYPCIQLELGTQTEQYEGFPFVNAHLTVVIVAYTHVMDIPTLMTGDANYKGITDLENDIKKAIGTAGAGGTFDPTLGLSGLLEFTFPRTEFAIREGVSDFPVRGVVIDCDLHYRTQLDTRT